MENRNVIAGFIENIDTLLTYISGERIINLIQMLAGLITGEGTPGLVSVILVAVLVGLTIWHEISSRRFCKDVRKCHSNFQNMDGSITSERLLELDTFFTDLREKKKRSSLLGSAWKKFRETTVDPKHEADGLRNTIRPYEYFSREDLGLEQGLWRQVPALFVSVGLLLTFLGLVAALYEVSLLLAGPNVGSAETTEGLKHLLGIASAKFIMSLVGLFCSIVFIFVLRDVARVIDNSLHSLCTVIEEHCIFISEQELLDEILLQGKEQTDQLKHLTTEMVAQIARPLTEELPKTIRESIAQAMAPAVEQLANSTSKGIESMADSASIKLADGIRESVQLMKESIERASQGFEIVTSRLDRSSISMGENVEKAVQSLSSQIGDLGVQMAGSSEIAAQKFNEATETMLREMKEAAKVTKNTFTDSAHKIAEASHSIVTGAEAGGIELERVAAEMAVGIAEATAKMRGNLLDPMTELNEKIESYTSRIEMASNQVGKYAGSVENSVIAVVSANEELKHSTQNLSESAGAVRGMVSKIEAANQDTLNFVDGALESIRTTSISMARLLLDNRNMTQTSLDMMQKVLSSIESSLVELKIILERFDKIDRALGSAFDQIDDSVNSSIEAIGKFQQEIDRNFGASLNRLQAVITQTEQFNPPKKE